MWAFTRFATLAWPAALLILWRAFGARVQRAVVALVCAATGAVSLWIAYRQIWIAAGFERARLSYLEETIERLDLDEPYWIDTREFGRTAPSGRSATSGNACER